jgi:hydroxymethylbilane synthase
MGDRITSDIVAPTLYHAVGQGALGVEIRIGDEKVAELCKSLTHWKTEWKCRAERSMLRVLEGGCSVPVGANTSIEPIDTGASGPTKSKLTITGTVTAMSGSPHVEHTLTGEVASAEEADALGEKLAKILIQTGAKEILEEIFRDREARTAAEKKVVVEEST